MSDQTLLLSTKLLPPVRQAGNLPRTRLVDALLAHSDRKLQLVVAPAGYGKTTLLTDFAAVAPFPVAWLTLDPADRDPYSFLEYLVAALRQPFPAFGRNTLRRLAGTHNIHARSAAVARELAWEVAATIPSRFLLILDDLQKVNESVAVTGFLDDFLRFLPENLRVVLASETDPSLTSLSRLTAEGQLARLEASDLRLRDAEVRTLAQRRWGRDLTQAQAGSLASYSDGCIATVLLSADCPSSERPEPVRPANSDCESVHDHAVKAALNRLTPEFRRFLLASTASRTIDVELCNALLGDGPWLEQLQAVDRSNLLLARLPGDPVVFRHHQRIRQLLQERMHHEEPEEFRRLHVAAARVLERRGDWSHALEHYQEASAYAEMAALLSRTAPQLEREDQSSRPPTLRSPRSR
jgi:LuxR family maltose regulon positive regulatory protein